MKHIHSIKNISITFMVLVITFMISVAVRFSNLTKPMGRHHEYVTAHILCIDYRFYTEGASSFYYSPVINFNAEAEKKCSKYYLVRDSQNNFYYYSYPAFAFLFPHFIFKTLSIEPGVLGIRIISLFIHLACSLFIYLIILKLFDKKIKNKFYFPAFSGFVLYTFATGNLWFHSQVYFSDILVQPFVLWIMLLLLKVYKSEKLKPGFYFLLFTLAFLAVYTEYLALFFLFFACLFFIIEFFIKKQKKYILSCISMGIAAISSLALTLYQYSKISSFAFLKRALTEKYAVRSGHTELAQNKISIKDSISFDIISEYYEMSYNFLLDFCWILLLLTCVLVLFKKNTILPYLKKGNLIVWLIGILAYFTHMITFYNFNMVHDFGTLKSTIFTVPFAGFCLGVFYEAFVTEQNRFKIIYSILVSIALIVFIHFSLNKYYIVNDYSNAYKFITEIPVLTKKYGTSEVLISSNNYFTYEACFYSKRRIESIGSLSELKNTLIFCDIKEGLFFERTMDHYNIYKINQKGDTLLYTKEFLPLLNL